MRKLPMRGRSRSRSRLLALVALALRCRTLCTARPPVATPSAPRCATSIRRCPLLTLRTQQGGATNSEGTMVRGAAQSGSDRRGGEARRDQVRDPLRDARHPLGLGNLDQCRTTGDPFFEGVSRRLFEIAKQYLAHLLDRQYRCAALSPRRRFVRTSGRGVSGRGQRRRPVGIPVGRSGSRPSQTEAIPGRRTGSCTFAVR